MTKSRKTLPQLSDEDVARFCNVVGLGPRKLSEARAEMTEKYNLGPRGVWIMGMIGEGVDSPSRMSELLCIRRSLFTAEFDRLVDAGLVKATRDQRDGRRLCLSLTAKGTRVQESLRKVITEFVIEHLAGYSRDEVLFCTRLLNDFAEADFRFG